MHGHVKCIFQKRGYIDMVFLNLFLLSLKNLDEKKTRTLV